MRSAFDNKEEGLGSNEMPRIDLNESRIGVTSGIRVYWYYLKF